MQGNHPAATTEKELRHHGGNAAGDSAKVAPLPNLQIFI